MANRKNKGESARSRAAGLARSRRGGRVGASARVLETLAWGGVGADGRLLPWTSPSREEVVALLKRRDRVVRVVIRRVGEAC
jgi:hypothetical protein